MELKNKPIDILESQVPKCPYTNSYCDIDIFRSMSVNPNKHCDTCPDYDKNYLISVKNSIIFAENNPDSNIHLIRKDLERDGGKFVSFGFKDYYGLLIGATSTNEDYYWTYLDKDKKIQYMSCVGMYEILDNIPDELSILYYLHQYQKDELYKIVKEQLDKSKHSVLITKIYI